MKKIVNNKIVKFIRNIGLHYMYINQCIIAKTPLYDKHGEKICWCRPTEEKYLIKPVFVEMKNGVTCNNKTAHAVKLTWSVY